MEQALSWQPLRGLAFAANPQQETAAKKRNLVMVDATIRGWPGTNDAQRCQLRHFASKGLRGSSPVGSTLRQLSCDVSGHRGQCFGHRCVRPPFWVGLVGLAQPQNKSLSPASFSIDHGPGTPRPPSDGEETRWL